MITLSNALPTTGDYFFDQEDVLKSDVMRAIRDRINNIIAYIKENESSWLNTSQGGDTPGGDTPGGDTPGGEDPVDPEEPGVDVVSRVYNAAAMARSWEDPEEEHVTVTDAINVGQKDENSPLLLGVIVPYIQSRMRAQYDDEIWRSHKLTQDITPEGSIDILTKSQ